LKISAMVSCPAQERTAQAMTKRAARKLDFSRKILLTAAGLVAITVAKDGPKMAKDTGPANVGTDFFFTGAGLGNLTVRNMTMNDFATWMQAGVMDRPVVDQTGLTDRYDFQLKWTPDDSQFTQWGANPVVPSTNDNPNAPPNLYTAIQQQLGLKIEPAKAPDAVLVIDHVEKPSPN
jgi:uncharacterized protein (TIGR03435 family)